MIRKEDLMVITREQRDKGYLLNINGVIVHLAYQNVSKLQGETFLVTHSHRIVE